MEIKILNKDDDYDNVKILLESLPRLWGIEKPEDYNTRILNSVWSYPYTLYGVYKNDMLSSTMAVYKWSTMNIVTLSKTMISPIFKVNSFVESGLTRLCDEILRILEESSITKYYASIPLKYYNTWNRIWEKNVSRHNNWNIYLDDIVKKNTKAEYKWMNSLMSDKVWPLDIAFKLGVLKNEYRKY